MTKLQIPCSYQGGKSRLAKSIVDVFFEENEIDEYTHFYDMCCGSGAISIELVNRGVNPSNITMIDKSPWGLFWQGIGDYTFSTDVFKFYIDDIPKDITKIKDYAQEMIARPANDGMFNNMVYKFLILQACAFGSTATWVENNRWKKSGGLRNYWLPTETSSRRSPVNPMMPMPETLFERVENISANMMDIKGHYDDVTNFTSPRDNSVIYIDPPYKNTTGYGHNFNIDSYIQELLSDIKMHNKQSKAYVSEGYRMTEEAHLLSQKRTKGGISGNRKVFNEEWLNVFK